MPSQVISAHTSVQLAHHPRGSASVYDFAIRPVNEYERLKGTLIVEKSRIAFYPAPERTQKLLLETQMAVVPNFGDKFLSVAIQPEVDVVVETKVKMSQFNRGVLIAFIGFFVVVLLAVLLTALST